MTLHLMSLLLGAGHDVAVITRKSVRSILFQEAVERQPRLCVVEMGLFDRQAAPVLSHDPLAKAIWDCDRLAPESIRSNLASRWVYDSNRFDLVVVSFVPDLTLLCGNNRVLLNVFGLPPDRDIARVERPLLARCSRMTFASNYTKREFCGLFDIESGDPGPVVHAGVQRPFFETACSGEKEFDVCFVGRVIGRKGIYFILEAMSRMKTHGRKITLAVVGDGRERQALQDRSADIGISGQVRRFGALGTREEVRILDRARCFLYPTILPEAFACGNLEAMARGVPVITTNLGGTSDYVCPQENALTCEPGSAESLAFAIERVLDDSSLVERLRDNGRKTAQRFHPDETGSIWLKVFEETLHANS